MSGLMPAKMIVDKYHMGLGNFWKAKASNTWFVHIVSRENDDLCNVLHANWAEKLPNPI